MQKQLSPKVTAGFAIGLIVLALLPAVQAGHNPQITAHCTYESGLSFGAWSFEDPVGVTADGGLNAGGCMFEFHAEDPWTDIEEGIVVDGEYTALQVALVDDVFGMRVGGSICNDVNGDLVCGAVEENEISTPFCGTSAVHEALVDTDGDGHKDFGNYATIFLNGPERQALNCDPTANPVGATSGGILNSNGGIFMMLSG